MLMTCIQFIYMFKVKVVMDTKWMKKYELTHGRIEKK